MKTLMVFHRLMKADGEGTFKLEVSAFCMLYNIIAVVSATLSLAGIPRSLFDSCWQVFLFLVS